jgi:hypothetical protein
VPAGSASFTLVEVPDDQQSDVAKTNALMMLKILDRPLMLFRTFARFERAEISSLSGLRVLFSGIEPILA